MEDAERNLPPQPLVGTTLFSEDVPVDEVVPGGSSEAGQPGEPKKDDGDVLSAFQNLLDRLF